MKSKKTSKIVKIVTISAISSAVLFFAGCKATPAKGNGG